MKREAIHLKEGNIGFALSSYDDIFSYFDPRDYSERSVSDDFLVECKKAAKDKEKIGLEFLISTKKRNQNNEIKIKKRLKDHFQNHFKEKQKKLHELKKEGWVWFFFGAIVMVLATSFYKLNGVVFDVLFIMAEPASWFLFWEGLRRIFIESGEKVADYHFYRKMTKCKIFFENY